MTVGPITRGKKTSVAEVMITVIGQLWFAHCCNRCNSTL